MQVAQIIQWRQKSACYMACRTVSATISDKSASVRNAINLATSTGRRLLNNRKTLMDANVGFNDVKAQFGKAQSKLTSAVASRSNDSVLPAVAAGYASSPSTVYHTVRSSRPVSRRNFLGYAVGTGGRVVESTVPAYVASGAKHVMRLDNVAAPFARYGGIAPSQNPATYALAATVASPKLRARYGKWLPGAAIGAGTITGGSIVADAMLD